jgi:hypothetical protein
MLGLHGRDRKNRPVPHLTIKEALIANLEEALSG